MANEYVVNSTDLASIADAIREKAGVSDSFVFPDGFVEAVSGISAGGGTDAEDGIVMRTITEYSNSRATKIGNYAFSNCSNLTSADFPNVTNIGNYAFSACTNLLSADFPNVTSIGDNAFSTCSNLTSADFPNATKTGSYTFSNCKNLTSANFPNVTNIGSSAFLGCNNLTSADFPKVTWINASAFYGGYLLKAVILRSESMCTLSNKSAFDQCLHIHGMVSTTHNPDGLKDGYFYVPKALLSDEDATKDYRRATNWSTYSDRFRALEDYTIDGTITGELDPNKI